MASKEFEKTRRIGGKTYATSRTVSDKGKVLSRTVSTENPRRAKSQTTDLEGGRKGTRTISKNGLTPGGRKYEATVHYNGKGKSRSGGKMDGYSESTVYGKQGAIYGKEGGNKIKSLDGGSTYQRIKKGPTKKPSN